MAPRLTSTERAFLQICSGIVHLVATIADAPIEVARRRSTTIRRRSLTTGDTARHALSRLKKKGWIRITGRSDAARVSLTKVGLAHAIIICARFHRIPLQKGTHCVVVFDIPETERQLRRELRLLLRTLDFVQVQKSVWIARHDAALHLHHFAILTGIKKWVRIFTGKESAHDQK